DARSGLVPRQHDLRQAVAREIGDRRAAAVVEVAVGEDVERLRLLEPVLEPDAGGGRRQLREELVSRGRERVVRRPGGTPGRIRAGGEQAGNDTSRQRTSEPAGERARGHAVWGGATEGTYGERQPTSM